MAEISFAGNPSKHLCGHSKYTFFCWVMTLNNVLYFIKDVAEKRIPIMLCGNKVDLRPEASAAGRKSVSRDDGERMARDHSAIFIETSAKDGQNVIDSLVQLVRYILYI